LVHDMIGMVPGDTKAFNNGMRSHTSHIPLDTTISSKQESPNTDDDPKEFHRTRNPSESKGN